jgi:hypothetical protein
MSLNYTFETLNPDEFEQLTGDLLSKHYNVPFERFSKGPDQGIDLRYAKSGNNEIIVQCKHYARSGFGALKQDCKKEVEKVKKLQPKRYVLVTSLGLTPQNKTDLQSIFEGYILEPSDIMGREDLNQLLSTSEKIELKHFKLWLTSKARLDQTIHSAEFFQNTAVLAEIGAKIPFYVQNERFVQALDILKKSRGYTVTLC